MYLGDQGTSLSYTTFVEFRRNTWRQRRRGYQRASFVVEPFVDFGGNDTLTEKTAQAQDYIVLPKNEWRAFADDVKQLIHADEELLNAYNKLLKSYDQLSEEFTVLSERGVQGKRTSGGRGLFGRRQAPDTARSCPNCGSNLEPKDKTCPACGKSVEPVPEQ